MNTHPRQAGRSFGIRFIISASIAFVAVSTAFVAVSTALLAVPGLATSDDAARSDGFRGSLWVRASYQAYESAPALAKASDLIVVGTIESVVESRTVAAVPEWGEDGNIAYVLAKVRVDKTIKGLAAAGELVDLELFVPVPSAVRSVVSTVPRERTLFFLSRKPDVPYYGLVNPEAYLRDLGGATPPVGAEQDWVLALRGQQFDAVVALVESKL